MKKVMFTKHLEGYDIGRIIESFASIGIEGADLCTRPDCPVSPENCEQAMPAAAKQFADAGMSIQICTTPGDFTDPAIDYADRLYAACGASGVRAIKLGYWHWEKEYWAFLDDCRTKLDGFEKLSAKHGVKTVVHNHSGRTMGLNASAVMRLMEGRDPAHVGVFADVGHLSVVGEPINMALDICWKYVDCIAVKDLVWKKTPADVAGERSLGVVPFGMGYVEWGKVTAELVARKYDGPVSFHCEYNTYPPDAVLAQCRVDKIFFEKLLAEAGSN